MTPLADRRVPAHRAMCLAWSLIWLLLVAGSVAAQAPPEGLHVVGQSGPYGQSLLSDDFTAPGSARALLPGVVRWVSGYFDRPLVLNGAIGDAPDQQVHAFFETLYRGSRYEASWRSS